MKQVLSLFFVVLLCISSSCHKRLAASEREPRTTRSSLLIDEHNTVREPLITLINNTGLAPTTALHDVVVLTQKSWLRPQGFERDQLVENYPSNNDDMKKIFADIGLVAKVLPSKKTYDYVLMLGSTYSDFMSRLVFLEELVSSGLNFKCITLLGSHRPLERQYEIEPMMAFHNFSTVPLTEIEMMDALFAESSFKTLDEKRVMHIASPMKIVDENRIMRANTLDTVEDFQKAKPKPGSVLVISSQPHVLRQHLVVERALDDSGWHIETVGSSARPDLSTTVYLDELARTLYQLDKKN